MDDHEFDVFMCHASKDKARFVEPLVRALAGKGVRAWYDRFGLDPGAKIKPMIKNVMTHCHVSVVIVSPYFWTDWTRWELGTLLSLEKSDRTRARQIIPVWCEIDLADVEEKAPKLAGRLAIHWRLGVDGVAREIARMIGKADGAPMPLPPGMGRARDYNLPARQESQTFTGREEEIAKLDILLSPKQRSKVAVAIEGLAGAGKTELALQMVPKLRDSDRFPGGIFWLDAAERDLSQQWGGAIADALAIPEGSTADRTRDALRIVTGGGPALLVLDSVRGWTTKTMPRPLPVSTQVSILATTRHRNLGGASFQHLALAGLPIEPARELLVATAHRSLEGEDGVFELLEYLDGHALAIELAGAYLCEAPDQHPAQYLALLRSHPSIEKRFAGHARHEMTVAQALASTCKLLDREGRRALRAAALFPGWGATVGLLREHGVGAREETALRRFHLVRMKGNLWSMHSLVRAYARRLRSRNAQQSAELKHVEILLRGPAAKASRRNRVGRRRSPKRA